MNRFTAYFCTFILVALCLWGISLTQSEMNTIKRVERLTDTDPVENAPPLVAFTTVALGCFRGLVADLLWLRSIKLQEQGKYFEMVQLASWICKLQPRFTGASVYLAWNMAYNISVTFADFSDRWRWVNNGLKLLREAVSYNPADPLVYREMGWIYLHKIGDVYDNANLYYKNEMAIEMTKVFGGVGDPDWAALAAAPANAKELSDALPKSSPVWADMERVGFKTLVELDRKFRVDGRLPGELTKICTDKDALRVLEDYLRAAWLRSGYGVDPAEVVRINNKYGRLDWRLPNSYAVYWGMLGIERSRERKSIDCERIVNNALKSSFIDGRLLVFGGNDFQGFMTVPNLNLADSVRTIFYDSYKNNTSSSFKSAYMNFMIDAILIYYNYGAYEKSNEYLNLMRKEFPGEAQF